VGAPASSSHSTISSEELNSALTAVGALREAGLTVPAQFPPAGPAGSLEVRWFVPGPPGEAVGEWFGQFPVGTEARTDAYLVWPRLDGLSVKLRDGGGLDVKSYLGSLGILRLPACGLGRLESWRKWSFACDAPHLADATPPGWVTVRKARRSAWFPLSASQGQAPGRSPEQAGCMAELTEADAGGTRCWTVGLEASGPAGLLLKAVQHAAGLLFAQPLPDGARFSLSNSRSYAQWLYQQPGLHPADSSGVLCKPSDPSLAHNGCSRGRSAAGPQHPARDVRRRVGKA